MYDFHQQTADDAVDILVVEDDPDDIRLLREAFDAVGHETRLRSVTDGDEAIDLLRRQATDDARSLPDLALVDLSVPGRNGYEILEAIRDSPQLGLLPVIILTSSDSPEDIERCYNARANAYLTKPNGEDEFASLVETVVKFWCKQVRLPPMAP